MSKNYAVGFSYTEFSNVRVRAESREEAERIVYKMLEDNGMLDYEYDAKMTDRDFSVDYIGEINDE